MEEEAGAVEEEAAPRANDRAHDSTSETFGIRSIEWGASFGLRLNGETIELTLTLTPTLTPTPTLNPNPHQARPSSTHARTSQGSRTRDIYEIYRDISGYTEI